MLRAFEKSGLTECVHLLDPIIHFVALKYNDHFDLQFQNLLFLLL